MLHIASFVFENPEKQHPKSLQAKKMNPLSHEDVLSQLGMATTSPPATLLQATEPAASSTSPATVRPTSHPWMTTTPGPEWVFAPETTTLSRFQRIKEKMPDFKLPKFHFNKPTFDVLPSFKDKFNKFENIALILGLLVVFVLVICALIKIYVSYKKCRGSVARSNRDVLLLRRM